MLEDKENIVNNTISYDRQKYKAKTSWKKFKTKRTRKVKASNEVKKTDINNSKVSLSSRGAGWGLREMKMLNTIVPLDEDDMFNPMDVSHNQSASSHSIKRK